MSEMPMLEGLLTSLPATILKLLNVESPQTIPEPMENIVGLFAPKGVDRVVIVMIDNFGLFEITYYKPEFMISAANALVLLSTQNPYTLGVFHQMIYGGFNQNNGFHLMQHLNKHQKSSVFVGRERDLKRYDAGTSSIPKSNDMAVWIEAAKVNNRHNFSWLHFLDFEEIYRSKRRTGAATPEELIQKLIKRTDKWILSMYKQLRSKSLMIVLGNHGRYKIDLNYQGKIAEWRAASVPLAICFYKE